LKFDTKAEQRFIKELIPRYAAGQGSLGRIITAADVERKRKEVTGYNFLSSANLKPIAFHLGPVSRKYA